MLNDIYTAIKTQLAAIAAAENTQWFNMQYENKGWPYRAGFFIEFPEQLNFDFVSNAARQAPLKVRVHVYAQQVQTHDGLPDSEVSAHETMALAVKTALERFIPEKDGAKLAKPFLFSGWRHWHRLNGWMVTYVEFDSKLQI